MQFKFKQFKSSTVFKIMKFKINDKSKTIKYENTLTRNNKLQKIFFLLLLMLSAKLNSNYLQKI